MRVSNAGAVFFILFWTHLQGRKSFTISNIYLYKDNKKWKKCIETLCSFLSGRETEKRKLQSVAKISWIQGPAYFSRFSSFELAPAIVSKIWSGLSSRLEKSMLSRSRSRVFRVKIQIAVPKIPSQTLNSKHNIIDIKNTHQDYSIILK